MHRLLRRLEVTGLIFVIIRGQSSDHDPDWVSAEESHGADQASHNLTPTRPDYRFLSPNHGADPSGFVSSNEDGGPIRFQGKSGVRRNLVRLVSEHENFVNAIF